MIGGLSKIIRYQLAGAGVIGILAAGGTSARAADVAQLEAAMKAMQAQMAVLQKQVEEAKAAAASAQTAAKSGSDSDLDLKVKWKGAPELSSANGKFKFKVRGRLETDYNSVNQDTGITSFPDVNATEFRRARLGIEGIMFFDWKYVFEVDFANDAVRGKDLYIQYQGFKLSDEPILLRIGNFKTPNTFEDETSDRFVDTMERASFINAWDIERQIGFMTAYYAPHVNLAAGIFGERFVSTVNAPLFPAFNGNEDTTFAARAGYTPINRELNGVTQVLHFGGSVRTRDAGDGQPFFTYGPNAKGADLHLANNPINTGAIGDRDTFWGVEGAGLWGPFSLQGEYAQLNVDLPGGSTIRNNGGNTGTPLSPNPFTGVSNPDYTGWYIEGSWFFGGHKTYEDEGVWGRPVVNNPMFQGKGGGWGAWQLVGKYDVLDMSDTGNQIGNKQGTATTTFVGACATSLLFPGVATSNAALNTVPGPGRVAECGTMKTWVVGVNWWMTPYMRLMFNYAQSDLGDYVTTPTSGTNLATPKAGFDGATIRGFGMRAQVDW